MTTTTPKTTAPECSDCDQIELKAKLDAQEAVHAHERAVADAETTAATALEKSEWDSEHELNKLYHTTIATVAQGSIDRVRDSAKFVQIAATAIAGLYTGILGFVFAANENPLPFRGVWAVLFLGLAIALATGYLAFIKSAGDVAWYSGGTDLAQMQRNRTSQLVDWVQAAVRNKRWALRAAVSCLALGVLFTAAPFVGYATGGGASTAPTAPTIPERVAPAVRADAKRLFKTQVDEYEAGVAARKAAAVTQAKAAKDASSHQHDLNMLFFVFALIGLLLALVIIPGIAEWNDDHHDPTGGIAAAPGLGAADEY